MTSGKHLTLEDRDRILRLAGSRTDDGGWRWSYCQIAERCDVHAETVSAVVRLAAAKWWQEHRWHPSDELS